MGETHLNFAGFHNIVSATNGPAIVHGNVFLGNRDIYCNPITDKILEVQSCCEMEDRPCNNLKEKLQAYYKNSVLPKVAWSKGGFDLPIENNFVQLQLHEDNSDTCIELKAIFHCNNNENRILIEGQPGFGKTTLATKLAYDWAIGTEENRYINQFKFVFFLSLRELQKPVYEAIVNLVKQCGFQLNDNALLKTILNHHLKEVLLILDGLDQISLEERNSILQILYNQEYSELTVIAFSRSGLFSLTKDDLKQLFSHLNMRQTFHNKLITILGIPSLDDKQQFLRINRITEDKIQSVKDCMLSHMALFDSPLLLKLLSIILEKTESNNELLLTQIEIFKKLFSSNIGDFELFHFKSREANDNQKLIQQFGNLAVEKIIKDDLKFDLEECVDHMHTFLKIYKRETGTETIKYCEASYRPIVEFAAAVAMWIDFKLEKQFTKDKLQAIVRHFLKTKGTSLVIPFLANLMEENLLCLIQEMDLFSYWFSSHFDLAIKFLLECTLKNVDKNISYLENYIPSEVDIRDKSFNSSMDLYKKLLTCDKIMQITINTKTPLEVMTKVTAPLKIVCNTPFNENLTAFSKTGYDIKEIFSYFPFKSNLDINSSLVPHFNFVASKHIESCAIALNDSSDMEQLSMVVNENKFNKIKFHFLEAKIRRKTEMPVIEKLIENNQVKYLKLSTTVGNELDMENFSQVAAASIYLTSIHLSFVPINLQHLTKSEALKKYDYIKIDNCTSTCSNITTSKKCRYLSINPLSEQMYKMKPTALDSYGMTIIDLYEHKPKWAGFESVKYLHLYEIDGNENFVNSITPWKNLHTLQVRLWEGSDVKRIANSIKHSKIKKIIIEVPHRPSDNLIKCMNNRKNRLETIDIIYFFHNDDDEQLNSELDELKKGLENKIWSKVNLVAYDMEMDKIFTNEDLSKFNVKHYTYGSEDDDSKPYQILYRNGLDRELHAFAITKKKIKNKK